MLRLAGKDGLGCAFHLWEVQQSMRSMYLRLELQLARLQSTFYLSFNCIFHSIFIFIYCNAVQTTKRGVRTSVRQPAVSTPIGKRSLGCLQVNVRTLNQFYCLKPHRDLSIYARSWPKINGITWRHYAVDEENNYCKSNSGKWSNDALIWSASLQESNLRTEKTCMHLCP